MKLKLLTYTLIALFPLLIASNAMADSKKSMMKYSAEDIKSAISAYITNKVKSDGGMFKIYDPQEKYDELELNFVKIHDPVRDMGEGQYFACTDFAVKGETGKLYDLDFWLNDLNGKLMVTQTQIHKQPKKVAAGYVKAERYTFINDAPSVVR